MFRCKFCKGFTMINYDYPIKATAEAKIDSNEYDSVCIGSNDLGSVYLHSSYGNKDSCTKIAVLIGMHPLESKAHRAVFDVISSMDDELNYEYFIYNIDVTTDISIKDEGRMDGQLLAREFVAPDIIGKEYDFFLDVHSNRGTVGPGCYEKTDFLFAPGFDEKSELILNKILSCWDEIEYYIPEYRTSPEYITVPTAKSGIATIVYETFTYDDFSKIRDSAGILVDIIDNLEFI